MLYSGVLTAVFALAVATSAGADTRPGKAVFDEIDVKRTNVREDAGTIRMIVSNTIPAPGIIMPGNERPHPRGNRAPRSNFSNYKGSANVDLTFDGRTDPHAQPTGSAPLLS